MLNDIKHLKISAENNKVYQPLFFRIKNDDEKQALNDLLAKNEVLFVHDEMPGQLQELIKSLNPSIRIAPDDYPALIEKHLNGTAIDDYGVWVYYPWSRKLVHLLDEDEFIEVRTNRNQYKITKTERDTLIAKKIGIIGLSVGQSIALTLAMERGFGELRLADFDILELSNLNRIRTGLHNMGIPKVVIVAREIAEIDPYLKVTLFFEGLTEEVMDDFFLKGGKLDILVDECDGLDIKILCRYKARNLRIPVIMDTSDRGMLDVERFDLEPDRPLLHGTVQGIDPQNIKELSNEDKIPVILQMLGVDNISLRAKASMVEVQQTINTWPQLASSVALGGAVGADVCRRILLDQYHESGRYYVDLDEFVADKKPETVDTYDRGNTFTALSANEMKSMAANVKTVGSNLISPNQKTIEDLVNAACAAPSTGNDQPWKWLYENGALYLFHDEYRSFSFGDFQKIASFISFGAAFENLYVHALTLGLEAHCQFRPDHVNERLVAAITFTKAEKVDEHINALDTGIYKRNTNRNPAPKTDIGNDVYQQLGHLAESIPDVKLQWFTDEKTISQLGDIIGACDRIRLLHTEAHHDFVHHEMRWTSEDAERTRDGIDIKTLGFSNSQMAALGVIKDKNVVKAINDLEGGKALDGLSKRSLASASALCLITLPKYNHENFFKGGQAMERLWLGATNKGLAVHPVISPLYIFPRITHADGEGLTRRNIDELKVLREKFKAITGVVDEQAEVFLTKIGVAPEPEIKSLRLPLDDVLFFA